MKLWIIAIAAIVGAAIGTAGTLSITKAVKPQVIVPPCPACNCPPATEVKLQTLDLETLRKVKGNLTITQSLDHVLVRIDCSDSTMIRKLLNQKK